MLGRSEVVVGGEVIPLIKCVHFNSMTGQIGEEKNTRVVTCIGSSVELWKTEESNTMFKTHNDR